MTSVLCERVQHHHILSLLDSLTDTLLDTQMSSVAGSITVLNGLVTARGREVFQVTRSCSSKDRSSQSYPPSSLFQNVPGLVTKLIDKMTVMAVDETGDMITEVGEVVHQLTLHNTRGSVTSLLHQDLPLDNSCRVAWVSMAGDTSLVQDVLDILMEVVAQEQVVKDKTADHAPLSAAAALTVLFETHQLEELCRQELGQIVSKLILLLSHYIGKCKIFNNPSSTSDL